jgi:hypothetical protein
MHPALSSGLRDGGRFDVIAIPLADPAAAQAAAETADAAALFYGSAAAPLPAALQAMAPKVRERGNRLVAVLQRDQAAHRDDCFRAGASDVLFMPMPRDQFVARLLASVGVVFTPEGSVQSPVAVATRSSTTRLERALVSPLGVEAPAMLPLKTGDTVRLSFAAFQSWGLVVRGGPSAQIRFAGLAPDEEAKIAEWVKSGGKQEPAPAPPRPSPAPMAAAPRPAAAGAPVAQARPPPRPPAPPAAAMPQEAATGARVAPPGPPPAMADRKPARPPAPVTPVQGAKPIAPSGATKGSHPANGQGGALAGLFDKADVPPPAPQPPPAPKGPPWPSSIPLATCKTAAM